MSHLPVLPNEIIDRLSKELTGTGIFHFTLATQWRLTITDNHLSILLRSRSPITLDKEVKSLLDMFKSPYMAIEDGIGLTLSTKKWSSHIDGAFQIAIIEKSLKYYSTTAFFVYCGLWPYNPFYYDVVYPTLNIFDYSRMIISLFVIWNF